MSDYDDDEYGYDDDDDLDDAPPGLFLPHSETVPNEDGYMPRPPLRRSRPPIDFSARRSPADTDLNFTAPAFAPPRSHMSGSTLHSSLRPSMAHSFPRNTSLHSAPLARLPLDAIAALTDSELHHNPHYRKLRRDHDHLASVLSTYLERDLAEYRTAKSEGLVPDIYQGVPRSVNSCRADSRSADSRASSLGPSDSASQQTGMDVVMGKSLQKILDGVEVPYERPEFLPITVLWDFEDCKTDTSQGVIITKKNKSRPRMGIALRRPNGKVVSSLEHSNMRRSAALIVQKLINSVNSDPRSAACASGRFKTFIKKHFAADYGRAVLDLEAEQKLLRLCSAHWKADAMITQVFLRRAKAEAEANSIHPTSPQSNQSLEPPTAFIPQIQEVAPMKAVKRAFELSPGPKSPSASHAQKRSKVPVVSGQKTANSTVPSTQNQRPAARKITPSFLSRTKVNCAEPGATSLRPLHIDPSADNLIAVLTSEFPSLTNAPPLLRSMNAQSSFKEGEPSKQVATLLERVQFADPSSPDIDEDNTCQSWGHYQFTAGGISPVSSLTNWQEVGNVATAFKLVAAAIKTCQEARLMCSNAGTPMASGFISDIYLKKILECSVRKSSPMNRKKTGTGPDCNRWQPDHRLRFIRFENLTGCGSSKSGIWVNRHRAGWDRSQPVFTTTTTPVSTRTPTSLRPRIRHRADCSADADTNASSLNNNNRAKTDSDDHDYGHNIDNDTSTTTTTCNSRQPQPQDDDLYSRNDDMSTTAAHRQPHHRQPPNHHRDGRNSNISTTTTTTKTTKTTTHRRRKNDTSTAARHRQPQERHTSTAATAATPTHRHPQHRHTDSLKNDTPTAARTTHIKTRNIDTSTTTTTRLDSTIGRSLRRVHNVLFATKRTRTIVIP
ncbi:hypothetical protein EDB85DRAFT_2155921 [Lactarius pseudohatsudake]|nr:hypothetical protein EDB85DRAFT_2155921 [Lactarius pseudohatsudake]